MSEVLEEMSDTKTLNALNSRCDRAIIILFTEMASLVKKKDSKESDVYG